MAGAGDDVRLQAERVVVDPVVVDVDRVAVRARVPRHVVVEVAEPDLLVVTELGRPAALRTGLDRARPG